MLALLGPLSALLGIEATSIKAKLKRQAALWGLLGALGLIAVAFLLIAINSALTYTVGPIVAPLIIAGAALFLGVVVFLIFQFRETLEAKNEADKKRSAEITALITTAAITALPLILPTLKKVALPAGGLAASVYALTRSRTSRVHD